MGWKPMRWKPNATGENPIAIRYQSSPCEREPPSRTARGTSPSRRSRSASPAPARCCVHIKASGVCHTDLKGVRVWPRRAGDGPRGRGRRARRRRGRDARCARRPRDAQLGHALRELLQLPRRPAQPLREQAAGAARAVHAARAADRRVVRAGHDVDGDRRAASRPSRGSTSTIPFTSACTMGCCVMTGYGSVVNVASVEPGSSVVVLGAGAVGICVIQAARIAGAAVIVAVDVNPTEAGVRHARSARRTRSSPTAPTRGCSARPRR